MSVNLSVLAHVIDLHDYWCESGLRRCHAGLRASVAFAAAMCMVIELKSARTILEPYVDC
jgi:hypothetical protein